MFQTHPFYNNQKENLAKNFSGKNISFDFKQIPIQPKLKVSQPSDPYEKQADKMAQKIVTMPNPKIKSTSGDQINHKCKNCNTKKELIHRKPSSSGSFQISNDITSKINTNSGKLLDKQTKDFMEPRFGYDFDNVRIHDDSQANHLAEKINARAFTYGSDVFFGRNESVNDRNLMAHELVHVVQQNQNVKQPGQNNSENHQELRHGSGTDAKVFRYSHDDCREDDLKNHIWPADHIARNMASRSISALKSPLTSRVQNLLDANFNSHSSSTISKVLANFQKAKSEFDDNDYQYECENDCDKENAYVYGMWTDIHLCMNKLRGKSNSFIGGVIVHEMIHYAAKTGPDREYFYPGPTNRTTLSPSDAVQNADSYEGFAARI